MPPIRRNKTAPAIMRQSFHELAIATRGRGLYQFTQDVKKWLQQNKACDGLLTLHLQHTSASLLIQENASPDVQSDFERFFERLVPDGDPIFEHTLEGDDDMPAHVRTALTTVNLSIPVHNGEMVLGTWQGIFLWEHRTHGHSRRVTLHFIGE
jgi:secondary thiamine-phosphate synthase enzyme